MIPERDRKQRMAKYLLDHMSEQERADFEKQYLADEELFEELVAAEAETIRSYLQGSGSEADRKEFENHFLAHPSRRNLVEFEKSLTEYVSQHPPAQVAAQGSQNTIPERESAFSESTWRFAVAAMLLVTLVGGLWLVIVNRGLSHQIQQLRLEQVQHLQEEERLRKQVAEINAQLEQQHTLNNDQQELIAQLQSPHPAEGIFTLMPGLVRRVDQQRLLVVARGLSAIYLRLLLNQDDHLRYSVSLETPEGARIWQQQNLTSLKPAKAEHWISLKIASTLLESRTYILVLKGAVADGTAEDVATYTFRIVK